MGKERVAKWDNVKFVLIGFVVIGHMIAAYVTKSVGIKSLYLFIYTFHMPAFIIISGMMMKNTIKNKRYEKLFTYLTMGVFIKLSQFAVKWFVLSKHKLNFFDVDDVSWYAFAIFVFALVTMYLQRFSPIYIMLLSLAMALAIGYDSHVGTYLTLSRIFVFYPFFFAGFCIDRDKLLEFGKKPVNKALAGVVIFIVAIVIILKHDAVYQFLPLLKGKSSYNSLDEFRSLGVFLRLAAYTVMFLMSFAVIIIIPNVKSFITTLGSRTLSVYALHFALIYILRDGVNMTALFKRISPEHYMYLSIVLAIAILFVTALKPVHIAVSKLINPTLLKTEEKE